ncbi:RND family efflux transporter, MFP subunit [Opitutaceae bacterium TAV1]|nr:RND family efflux transporter, MFP subunit [Opitutaceae bacterium TAV1]
MKRFLLILLVLALAGGALWFWLGGRTRVTVAAVKRDTAVDAVPAIVNVRPAFNVTINSEVAGLVLRSNLKPGKIIKEGELLIEIDPTTLRIEVERLTNQIDTLKARFELNLDQQVALERRKEDLETWERQYREGTLPELEIKRRRRDLDLFVESQKKDQIDREQQLRELGTQLKLKQQDLDKTKLLATTTGTVTDIYVYPGELVSNRSPVVRLFSDEIVVEARINEEDFSGIKPGLEAWVRLLTYGDTLYPAKLVQVLPDADTENQQYRAFLEVKIDPARLLPGLTGEASIVRSRRPDSLVVPRQAVFNGAVFRVESGTVRLVPVKTGFRGLNQVQIVEGLKEGDEIVVSGLDNLKDGDRVDVTTQK